MDPRRQIVGFSDHGRQRMAQRNVSEDDVAFILAHGAMVHRTGVLCFTLTARSIPVGERGTRLSLTSVVVLVKHGWVITVYRNRRPLRHIRHKAKYHYRPDHNHTDAAPNQGDIEFSGVPEKLDAAA